MTKMPNPTALSFVQAALRSAPIVIADCGSAGGIDPIFDRLSGWGVVQRHGFEPNPIEFEKLISDRTTAHHQLAISDRVGQTDFHASATFGAIADRSAAISAEFKKITVDVETIDNLVATNRMPGPHIIKTDIEGHDFFALKGASGSLANSVLCVKSEIGWHDKDSFPAIHTLLLDHGFMTFGLSYSQSTFGPLQGSDVLYLRSIDKVLTGNAPRDLAIRLIAISSALGFLEYAALCAKKAEASGALSSIEAADLVRTLSEVVYLPETVPNSRAGSYAALCLYAVASLSVGWLGRSKSMPKFNQLRRMSALYRRSKRGTKAMVTKIESAINTPDDLL